jgi:hypothetical protein
MVGLVVVIGSMEKNKKLIGRFMFMDVTGEREWKTGWWSDL